MSNLTNCAAYMALIFEPGDTVMGMEWQQVDT